MPFLRDTKIDPFGNKLLVAVKVPPSMIPYEEPESEILRDTFGDLTVLQKSIRRFEEVIKFLIEW